MGRPGSRARSLLPTRVSPKRVEGMVLVAVRPCRWEVVAVLCVALISYCPPLERDNTSIFCALSALDSVTT